jgi:cullin 3
MVIQNNCWSIEEYQFNKINVPTFLQECLDDFSNFYQKSHTNLQLNFCYYRSELEVTTLYLKKKYMLQLTLVQFVAIYCLEKKGELSVEQIMGLTEISQKALVNDLYFLLWGPFNPKREPDGGLLLTSGEPGEEVAMSDLLKLNMNFVNPTIKVSCLPVALKSRKNEDELEKKEKEEQKNNRKYMNDMIDSSLVRIMKGRKDMVTTHQELINEVSSSINLFNANPTQIKERIESLIERKLLKRADNNRNCYEYIS